MAIIPLPKATIHLLGSAQALTTPLSLVKELIDNSVDANATSIEVLISQNTLDKIEVRDNGHGIAQEDLDALGRRGHTSKLRAFEELRSIGGVSLGFRGEALASAVQLGEVSVTTKTDGEAVATFVKLRAPGGVAMQSKTSHPVGTTVSVKNFVSNLPVRKQTALKAAPKTLVKVKELLQSYALARSTIRFNLKVLKEIKGSWSFSPQSSGGIRAAVSQVIGRDAAAECVEKCLEFPERDLTANPVTSSNSSTEISSADEQLPSRKDLYAVELFLPRPGANPAKVGHGQYLSIDYRPVSHEKGTMRKIVTLFKYYLRGLSDEATEKMKNPFLRMNINCPKASYDPNVEPAKDDVLFGNENVILESLECLFKEIYGEPQTKAVSARNQSTPKNSNSFELLLARAPSQSQSSEHQQLLSNSRNSPSTAALVTLPSTPPPSSNATNETQDPAIHTLQPSHTSRNNKWDYDMSVDFTEEVDEPQLTRVSKQFRSSQPRQSQSADYSKAQNQATSLNPWVIAKSKSSDVSSTQATTADSNLEITDLLPDTISPSVVVSHAPSAQRSPDGSILVSTRPRERRMSNPVARRTVIYPTPQRLMQPVYDGYDNRPTNLHVRRRARSVDHDDPLFLDDEIPLQRTNAFVSAKNIQDPAPLTPPFTGRPRQAKRAFAIRNPFVSPLQNLTNFASLDSLRQTTIENAYRAPPQTQPEAIQNEVSTDSDWAMQYERIKENATREMRQKIRETRRQTEAELAKSGTNATVIQSPPHKNRYDAAVARLDEDSNEDSTKKHIDRYVTSLPPADPRAYLMKQQWAMSANTPKPEETIKAARSKSTRLPLEKVPDTELLHSLAFAVPVDIESIRSLVAEQGKEDTYIQEGCQSYGLRFPTADKSEIIGRIQVIASRWAETGNGKGYEFEYNFGSLLTMVSRER